MASFEKVRDAWRVHVRRVGFKSLSKTFPTKAAAQDWAARTEASISKREHQALARSNDTVRDIFERYRDEVSPTRKGHANERVRINVFLKRAEFVHRRLDQLMPLDLKEWRNVRVKEVTKATVNRELNLISGIFAHAIREWDAPFRENPVHLVAKYEGADKARNRRWAPADLERFLEACKWDPKVRPSTGRDFVPWAVLLAIETAMRRSELCALKAGDVFLEERYVTLHTSKNSYGRDVPLTKAAQELLATLVEGLPPEAPLFPILPGTLGVYFNERRDQAGVVDIRFHDTRHEAATRLSKKFANVLQLSAVTGHRSLQSLKRYYNPTAAELVAKLDQ